MSTRRTYRRAYNLLKQFYVQLGEKIQLPIPIHNIALFISFLDLKGYAKSSITSYVSAIGYYHRTLELYDISNSNLIKRCLAGLKQKKEKGKKGQ